MHKSTEWNLQLYTANMKPLQQTPYKGNNYLKNFLNKLNLQQNNNEIYMIFINEKFYSDTSNHFNSL